MTPCGTSPYAGPEESRSMMLDAYEVSGSNYWTNLRIGSAMREERSYLQRIPVCRAFGLDEKSEGVS